MALRSLWRYGAYGPPLSGPSSHSRPSHESASKIMPGGFTLYVKDGKPVYEYNYFAHERYTIASSETLSPGRAVIRVDFAYDGGGIGKGATARLFVNDKKVAEGRIEKSCPSRFGAESFDVGMMLRVRPTTVHLIPFTTC